MRVLLYFVVFLGCGGLWANPRLDDEVVVLETAMGKVVAVLWPDEAPETVKNFKKLVNENFYDGTAFHRVIKNFLVQGGDPLSRDERNKNVGTGGPGYQIKAEVNGQSHVKGVLSMARDEWNPDTAGSQFFFCLNDRHELNGRYTAFGRVIEGMEVLEQMGEAEVTFNYAGERSLPVRRLELNVVRLEPRARYEEAIARLSRMEKDSGLMEALRRVAKDPNAPLAPIPAPPVVGDDAEVLLLKTSIGEMSFVLWDEEAPNAVGLIKRLVKRKYYDGTMFHRVLKRFVAQGGCPFSRDPKSHLVGTGGREEGQGVAVEYVDKVLKRGYIALARADGDRGSSGAQFFIALDELPQYRGRYAIVGQLLKGEAALNAFGRVNVEYGRGGEKSRPVTPVVIFEAQIVSAREARSRP